MVRCPEKFEPRVSKPRKSIKRFLAASATSVILAGCSSNSEASQTTPATSPPSTIATKNNPTTTTLAPNNNPTTNENQPPVGYFMSSVRNERIAQAMTNFALRLEANAQAPNGIFDAYCTSLQNLQYEIGGGWLSQGYQTTAGQYCEYRHSQPDQGFKPQLDATVIVGPNGKLTNQVQSVTIEDNGNGCYVYVIDEPTDFIVNGAIEQRNAENVQLSYGSQTVQTFNATSLAQAESIDNQALACINKTRP